MTTEFSLSLDELVAQLRLDPLEQNLFRGSTIDIGTPNVYGGQVLGQALMAASHTVEGLRAHSMHAYFLRAGSTALPIVYDVERTRDGHSFSTRRVVAIQKGRPIFTMTASFHKDEPGVMHQIKRPQVLPVAQSEQRSSLLGSRPLPFAVRSADWNPDTPEQPVIEFTREGQKDAVWRRWFQPNGHLPDDPHVHQALLAYVSDFSFVRVAMRPHTLHLGDRRNHVASLDHAMWFHRDFRFDDWLLYDTDSPMARGARGFYRGSFFSTDGELIASVAQEGLIRAPVDEHGNVLPPETPKA
jgi:acyl-CoA thioesterase-2